MYNMACPCKGIQIFPSPAAVLPGPDVVPDRDDSRADSVRHPRPPFSSPVRPSILGAGQPFAWSGSLLDWPRVVYSVLTRFWSGVGERRATLWHWQLQFGIPTFPWTETERLPPIRERGQRTSASHHHANLPRKRVPSLAPLWPHGFTTLCDW